MTDVSKLSDRELDALIAAGPMGWTDVKWSFDQLEGIALDVVSGIVKQMDVPKYSTDRNDASLVLQKIRGSDSFVVRLWNRYDLVYASTISEIGWAFLEATPRQLMEAAYLAWEGVQ